MAVVSTPGDGIQRRVLSRGRYPRLQVVTLSLYLQILITAQQPAYELRHNQMESIFLSAVDSFGHGYQPENLQNLILSETSIFDILHDFFYHHKTAVRVSSLEVGSTVERSGHKGAA